VIIFNCSITSNKKHPLCSNKHSSADVNKMGATEAQCLSGINLLEVASYLNT